MSKSKGKSKGHWEGLFTLGEVFYKGQKPSCAAPILAKLKKQSRMIEKLTVYREKLDKNRLEARDVSQSVFRRTRAKVLVVYYRKQLNDLF